MTDLYTNTLNALQQGRPVLVADDFSRENEVDVVLAAQHATEEWIAWTVNHTSGYLCAPMPNDVADRLNLPLMVDRSEDTFSTAYCVAVDARAGVTTGISAQDRALTARALAATSTTAGDLKRPGHLLPLRAVDGGLLERRGHTEAAVELCRLAGLRPVGIIAELVNPSGTMMRFAEAQRFADEHQLPLVTTSEICEWLTTDAQPHARVRRTATASLPTEHGTFTIHTFEDALTGSEHVALVSCTPGGTVRIHSECLTGDIVGSLRCDCGPQLHESLRVIAQEGGALVYLRGHEGRGIGLTAKIRAYALQERGLDTVDANVALGYPEDAREYGGAAAIIKDLARDYPKLGEPLTVLTNNPLKVGGLEQAGVSVKDTTRIVVGRNELNSAYLDTKAERMGHSYH